MRGGLLFLLPLSRLFSPEDCYILPRNSLPRCSLSNPLAYAVDARACVRCAACATVAPAHFSVGAGPARMLRAPANERERTACEAATIICPTQAISKKAPAQADPPAPPEVLKELYPTVSAIAEGVRWKLTDVPWDAFDLSKATAPLKAMVREMAYSEYTTFSATQRFMETFDNDTDFSQWVSVWFYEETRHPMVLLKWLELAGEVQDPDFAIKGRVSVPFMKSTTGTLVTNVISEMVAAEAYVGFVRVTEPVLAALAQRIGADEARHGASFFTYARRAIANSAEPDRERLAAMKVLHFWMQAATTVSHPVNVAVERMRALLPAAGEPPFVPPFDRIVKMVGNLVGLPMKTVADLPAQLEVMMRRVHATGARSIYAKEQTAS